jgi:hypothetical protein
MPTATAADGRVEPAVLTHGAAPTVASRLLDTAARPVATHSTAVFRITFGVLVCASSIRFLARGWVDRLYLEPAAHLTYPGFDWIRPWPAPWMHLHVVALAAAGACIALGYHHRAAAVVFVLGFAHAELIDAALYLNHYWYLTLAGVLLAVLPVHHHWSLDARAGRVRASPVVPAAVVWALRGQLAVVYVFAGLAKVNTDWAVDALPLRLWLADRTDVALVGPFLDEPFVAHLASWAALLFDATIVAWLLWRRSRRFAYAAVVVFHLTTWWLFPQIGVFPWVMIAGTLVFFAPDWPARLLGRAKAASPSSQPAAPTPAGAPRLGRPVLLFLGVLAVVQVVVPLRHLVYSGDVRWTEEGYYLSWRVMLTEKAGHVDFRVRDPATGRTWAVGPDLVLTDWQAAQAAIRPDLLQTTARLVASHYEHEGVPDVEVRADAFVSVNGRPARRLVDPAVDLAAEGRGLGRADWILRTGDSGP